ncbi:MAG: 16S rRNA (uracil(1498)-N(3))-methyltransferase [Pseudomonadales bacterium]|nr:16S rRNA (uracil(1498)-N(3))-methyltransferase [Gammaproteobacteria bacterium]NNL56276.1 16S rRNA (uracil(1498)-N(3))-methyltransferase [Pseudomonadales bacterium]
MRSSRIYCPQALAEGEELALEPRNLHYLLHVLRVKPGAALRLFDGGGSEYNATVTTVGRKAVRVRVGEACASGSTLESPLHTTLAIAVSKGERMDWVMQKATELGVSAIQPLLSRRVDVKLDAQRAAKRLEHWRGIVVAACEQCGRRMTPKLHSPHKFDDWLGRQPVCAANEVRLTMQADGCAFAEFAQRIGETPAKACLLVGPEGGLEDGEISAAAAAGFTPVCVGKRVFRTETAPVVGLSLLQYRWGDFS